jgi:hypothetical protein
LKAFELWGSPPLASRPEIFNHISYRIGPNAVEFLSLFFPFIFRHPPGLMAMKPAPLLGIFSIKQNTKHNIFFVDVRIFVC